MIVVDVNLLLYSVITGFPHHKAARRWWEETLNGSVEVALTSPALFGFLRIATNPKVLETPLAVEAAVSHAEGWLELPSTRFLQPGPRHLEIAFDLLKKVGTASNLTTDIQLAALALEHDATICSNDTDFARFEGLEWANPLAA